MAASNPSEKTQQDRWNLSSWDLDNRGSGAYSRLFLKETNCIKVSIVDDTNKPMYVIANRATWKDDGFDPVKLVYPHITKQVKSVTKDVVTTEVSIQQEVACKCLENKNISFTPLIWDHAYLEQINPSDYGFEVYHLSKEKTEGYAAFRYEGDDGLPTTAYFKQLSSVNVYMIKMEYIHTEKNVKDQRKNTPRNFATNVNKINELFRMQKNKLYDPFRFMVYKWCRSLVFLLFQYGIVYVDFHLQNFILVEKLKDKQYQGYVLDFGSARRMTVEEQTRFNAKELKENPIERLKFIVECLRTKTPALFDGTSDRGSIYQWLWNGKKSTDKFDATFDESATSSDLFFKEREMFQHYPFQPFQCVYQKNATKVCFLQFQGSHRGGTKKKKRKSTSCRARKRRAVSVALSPFRWF